MSLSRLMGHILAESSVYDASLLRLRQKTHRTFGFFLVTLLLLLLILQSDIYEREHPSLRNYKESRGASCLRERGDCHGLQGNTMLMKG